MSLVMSQRTGDHRVPLLRTLQAVIVLGALGVLSVKLMLVAKLPLWVDETFTAMIVTQPDWHGFWKEVWLDCNPPLYYLLLSLWTSIFGDSNLALRLPTFLFLIAAGLAPHIWRPKGLTRIGVWTWSALILFWGPSVFSLIDARCYGLLVLLSTLSCLAASELYERLTLRGAAIWAAIGTLMFVTHYFSALFIGAQAMLIAYRYRFGLLRVWPAGLLALPGLLWFVYHVSRLKEYGRPDAAWYLKITVPEIYAYVAYAVGGNSLVMFPIVVAVVVLGLRLKADGSSPIDGRPASTEGLWAIALAGWAGLALAIVIGLIQPSMTYRYLLPIVPPVMLSLVLLSQRSSQQSMMSLLLVIVYLLPGLNFRGLSSKAEAHSLYGNEEASGFLAKYKPTRLIFIWDSPNAKILDLGSMSGIGGYFFKRNDFKIPTTPLVVGEDEDPNAILRRAATGQRPAIIWLYNKNRRSAARLHKPVLQNDAAWKCKQYRRYPDTEFEYGAIACVKMDAADA